MVVLASGNRDILMAVSSMQHHPHHAQRQPTPQHLSRPPSTVHQQSRQQAAQVQHQHPSAYQTNSIPPVYQQHQPTAAQQPQDISYYAHPSPYSTPGATGGYPSADTPEMMATTAMPRAPYPSMSYHTPQSNSPASVPSPAAHDHHQHRAMYAPQAQHLGQQSMYYGQQAAYQPLAPQPGPPSYGQHPQHQHQSMISAAQQQLQQHQMQQHAAQQHAAQQHVQHHAVQQQHQPQQQHPVQHPVQHPSAQHHQQHQHQHQHQQHQHQHQQNVMSGSPRHTKLEPQTPIPAPAQAQQQVQRQQQPVAPQHVAPQAGTNGAGAAMQGASNAGAQGVNNPNNPNAAPGPIPATTPLVVKQDSSGVQWIAFEYSRDRVKMEYTIRCDVENVNTDELTADFKSENCVYPRACCAKDQYRGNRLQYETECNTVGWALAQLNPPLRGKRGLIQRAVDSWRNSNQDPRLRSRRVRRMAKMTTRKVQGAAHPGAPHMGAAAGPTGMPGAAGMGKPALNHMGQPLHHQQHGHPDGSGQGGGDEVGDGDSYMDDQPQQARQQTSQQQQRVQRQQQQQGHGGADVKPVQLFAGAGFPAAYPTPVSAATGPSMVPMPSQMTAGGGHLGGQGMLRQQGSGAIAASSTASASASAPTSGGRKAPRDRSDDPEDLFPDMPEAKKRKFILVDDNVRGTRLRVRVTLDGVDTKEIPDSFRKGASVYPRSYFPREMQSPPPSATGSRFFLDDRSDREGNLDDEDDGREDTEGGRGASRRGGSRGAGRRGRMVVQVKVPVGDGEEAEVDVPRMRRAIRGKEVRLNDLGYRMAWLQSRVFAGRTVFLQRALDCYRDKTRSAIESVTQDTRMIAPHYETRIGKKQFSERMKGPEKTDE